MARDIFDIGLVNQAHHALWEKHGRHWYARGRRTLQGWHECITGWREARSAAQHERVARRRAEEKAQMEMQTLRRAQVKTMLGQLDEGFLQALTEELYEQRREELYEQALAVVRQEHEAEIERERERTRDALARHKKLVEDEVEGELEKRLEDGRRELRDEFSERIDTLRDERNQARQERDHAETLLVAMVKELCSGKKNYLYSGGAGLRNLDVVALNETLGKHQLKLKASMTYSERIVNCRVSGDQWRGRTVFTLEAAAPGVDQEPDEDAGAAAEVSQDGTSAAG